MQAFVLRRRLNLTIVPTATTVQVNSKTFLQAVPGSPRDRSRFQFIYRVAGSIAAALTSQPLPLFLHVYDACRGWSKQATYAEMTTVTPKIGSNHESKDEATASMFTFTDP